MSVTFRVIALSLIAAFCLSGPLAPLAGAQQPATPPPPAPQTDLFQESLKAGQAESPFPDRSHNVAYDVGAALADGIYIPGKVAVCVLGIVVGTGILAITLGSGYRLAAAAGNEGCGGKWFLTGRDLRPSEPMSRTYDIDPDSRRY